MESNASAIIVGVMFAMKIDFDEFMLCQNVSLFESPQFYEGYQEKVPSPREIKDLVFIARKA